MPRYSDVDPVFATMSVHDSQRLDDVELWPLML